MGVIRDGVSFTGTSAWEHVYGNEWASMKLAQTVGAFVEGGANMVAATGIPLELAVGIIAVMVACFAATTLDSATRLQRYVLQEMGAAVRLKPLTNKFVATGVAVGTGGALAMVSGPFGPGSGGFILWPLFGAVNQLLAGLAFMVIAFYLIRYSKPIWFLVVPLVLMVVLPAIAMCMNIAQYYRDANWILFIIGVFIEILQGWMILEGLIMWRKARGVLPEPLPPLQVPPAATATGGGRSC
jgi:carbon starvation protein